MGTGDPEQMVRMAETDVLLDALEERVPEEEDLREGLADLLFHGPLYEEYVDEFDALLEEGRRDPPTWRQHP